MFILDKDQCCEKVQTETLNSELPGEVSKHESVVGSAQVMVTVLIKGATSWYFESFSATYKITFSMRETRKY